MRTLAASILALGCSAIYAVDVPTLASVDDDQAGEWITEYKFGAFYTNVTTGNAVVSHDPSISGSHESTAWQLTFDGKFNYIIDSDDHIDQMLQLRYGRIKQDREDWVENSDLVDYDGAYKHFLRKPHFLYTAWGLETVFTGPEPDTDPFDPALVKVSAGYGQEYTNLKPLSDKLEFRVGVRAQQRFGENLTAQEDDFEVGPEFYARYERKQTEALSYFAQYEAFDEFNDLGHISNLITAGLDLLVVPYLTVRLAFRGYYETEPDDSATGAGYDEFSYREETLVGLTWTL